jgi:hypothetical protein
VIVRTTPSKTILFTPGITRRKYSKYISTNTRVNLSAQRTPVIPTVWTDNEFTIPCSETPTSSIISPPHYPKYDIVLETALYKINQLTTDIYITYKYKLESDRVHIQIFCKMQQSINSMSQTTIYDLHHTNNSIAEAYSVLCSCKLLTTIPIPVKNQKLSSNIVQQKGK